MQLVVVDFDVVAEPVDVWVWSTGDDAVEARHLTVADFQVTGDLVKYGFVVFLGDATGIAVSLLNRWTKDVTHTPKLIGDGRKRYG